MNYADNSLGFTDGRPGGKRFAIWMWVLLFTLVGSALQQYLYGQAAGLTGAVTDPSGAAVSDAQVTFRNEATGITAQFATSSMGVYTATLPAGTYDITVEAQGFKRFEATHVVVEIGATPTFNIKLDCRREQRDGAGDFGGSA